MNHSETALARSRAYSLFARIFMKGLSADSVSIVNQLPEFADLQEQDTAEWAALFHHIFSMNVFAYETIFVDASGLLGGAVTESVAAFYAAIGFPQPDNSSADHIAIEFSALAFLCAAEADAREDKIAHEIQRMIHLQRRFLDEHLLCWLPTLVKAIINQGHSFYSTLAELVLKLTLEHRATIGDDLMQASVAFSLPQPPDPLLQEKTGLKDIANYLLTTAYAGFYLAQDDIKRIGNRFHIPRGFGKRSQVLSNLLQTAADYEQLPGVLEALHDFAEDWRKFYTGIEASPSLMPMIALWDERLAQTQVLLKQIWTAAAQNQLLIEDFSEE